MKLPPIRTLSLAGLALSGLQPNIEAQNLKFEISQAVAQTS